MYFFTRRVAQTIFWPLRRKPCNTIRAYNFWFDVRTLPPSLEDLLNDTNTLPVAKTMLPPLAVLPITKNFPGMTISNTREEYEHKDLKPHSNVKWPAIKRFPYEEKGLLGDPGFVNLKAVATKFVDYNPKIGTEVHGVDLTTLTDAQKNDIARLIATRGVVFFRDQKNFSIEKQQELGAYFGILHKHAPTSVPGRVDLDDIHGVFSDEDSKYQQAAFTPTDLWYSDVSYELQPPSYASFKLLTSPRIGNGDTFWSSQYAAYDHLSAPMQAYVSSLTAIHSTKMQNDDATATERPFCRDSVITAHPLVRTHPVTGWKSLYYNPSFVTKIADVPTAEGNAIMAYLNQLTTMTQELQVCFQWRKDDVAFWDSRVCNCTAKSGLDPHRNHTIRVACHAERPYFDPASKSQEEECIKKYGIPQPDKNRV